jgi:hypothetical protein
MAVRSSDPDVCTSLTDPFSTVQPAPSTANANGNGHRRGGDAQDHKTGLSRFGLSHARETANQVAEGHAD